LSCSLNDKDLGQLSCSLNDKDFSQGCSNCLQQLKLEILLNEMNILPSQPVHMK